MTPGLYHRRFGPVIWGAAGVTFVVLAMTAVLRIDPRIAGYAVSILLLVCLALWGAVFWLDAGAARTTNRFVDKLRERSPTG